MRRAAVVIVLLVGLGSILAQCLVPPWRTPNVTGGIAARYTHAPRIVGYNQLGYHPLWNPPDVSAEIDLVRLCVPCVAVIVFCSGVFGIHVVLSHRHRQL